MPPVGPSVQVPPALQVHSLPEHEQGPVQVAPLGASDPHAEPRHIARATRNLPAGFLMPVLRSSQRTGYAWGMIGMEIRRDLTHPHVGYLRVLTRFVGPTSVRLMKWLGLVCFLFAAC